MQHEKTQNSDGTKQTSTETPYDNFVIPMHNEAQIRRLFERIDQDHSGILEKQEVEIALRNMSLPTFYAEEVILMLHNKPDGKGVTYEEFRHFILRRERQIKALFDKIDRDKDNFVEYEEIKQMLKELKMDDTETTVRKLIDKLEQDGHKKIDIHEFTDFLSLMPHVGTRAVFDLWMQSTSFDLSEDTVVCTTTSTKNTLSPMGLLLAGGIAGAVSRTFTAPLDRLKTLYQVGGRKMTSIWVTCQSIVKEEGWLAFYKGNGTNVLKIAPETAIKFWSYESLRNVIAKNPEEITPLERFISGALAGLCAQTIVYPLEITKTRLAIAKEEYSGILDCLKKIIKFEGPRSLYKGVIPALAGILPYSGVDLAIFSYLKDSYTRMYPDRNPGALTLLACGAFSSTCGQLVAYPLVVVRTRLQAQGMPSRPVLYKGMLDCFQTMIRLEGFASLYRGILLNFMKAVPAISISYLIYEKSKEWLSARL